MPPKTYKRKTRRQNRKKRTARLSTFRPQNQVRLGFPKTTMVKLRYCDAFQMNPGLGAVANYQYRANSLFDPDVFAVGHQPMNFDQWSLLYNHYVVVGAKITVQIVQTDTGTIPGFWGIILADDTTVSSDAITLMEQGLTKYKNISTGTASSRNNNSVISKGFSCKKFFNLKNPTDNITRVGSIVTGNPLDPAIFHIFYGSLPALGSDPPVLTFSVKIDYIAIFSEPKEQPTS